MSVREVASRRRAGMWSSLGLVFGLLIATTNAWAQVGVGEPTDYAVLSGANSVIALPGGCQGYDAAAVGGVTMFGATAPNGTHLGLVQLRHTFDGEGQPECPGFFVPGVPAGSYWVAHVYGLVNTRPALSVSAWKPVTVGNAGCTSVPFPPILMVGSPVITGNHLSLSFGNQPGCPATRIDLEVGSQPGLADVGTIPLPTLGISTPAPAGTFYVRARGVNQFGRSEPSIEVPIQIPNSCASSPGGGLPQGPINPTPTVFPGGVTISWTQTLTNTTFYSVVVKELAGRAIDHLVLDAPRTSVTATGLPPGTYRVAIAGGNACGTKFPVTDDLIFTVP